MQMIANIVPLISLLGWCILWGLGGIWIARSAFNLRRNEVALAGLGLGLLLENWLANLLGQFLPVPLAFWIAALLVLAAGFALIFPQVRRQPLALFQIPIYPLQWLTFALLIYVFVAIGRGLALLDDFQNLPVTSLIATGDIPPHFPLDPGIRFGYHYFSQLLAAQLMHIADVYVWTALDMARGFGFSLSLMLSGLFVQRVTGSVLAGFVGGLMAAFAGGTRWLLLLFPGGIVARLGADLSFLGSGASTADHLSSALVSPWAAAGMGPFPFPFAYVNGFNPTQVLLYHSGAGGLSTLLLALLLLVHNRWRGWRALGVTAILLAALGLANEVSLAAICLGIVLVMAIYALTRRTWRLPARLWSWFAAAFAGGLVALFQGGVLTALVLDRLARILPGDGPVARAYHTFEFSLFWPPKVLSSHLGYLSLDNPAQILLALLEIGPILLVIPLVGAWMVKAFRFGRWYECFLGSAAVASLGLFVVELSGAAGLTALTRAQSLLLSLLATFAVPALWLWMRNRSEVIKTLAAAFLFVTMFGGIILFGISLVAVQQPVTTEFVFSMDAAMTARYWDALEPDALVFDPNPYRAPVIFGRSSRSSDDWFVRKVEWLALREEPDPAALQSAGYRYLYLDESYWRNLSPAQRSALQDSCVIQVHEEKHKRLDEFRRLLDVSECR